MSGCLVFLFSLSARSYRKNCSALSNILYRTHCSLMIFGVWWWLTTLVLRPFMQISLARVLPSLPLHPLVLLLALCTRFCLLRYASPDAEGLHCAGFDDINMHAADYTQNRLLLLYNATRTVYPIYSLCYPFLCFFSVSHLYHRYRLFSFLLCTFSFILLKSTCSVSFPFFSSLRLSSL